MSNQQLQTPTPILFWMKRIFILNRITDKIINYYQWNNHFLFCNHINALSFSVDGQFFKNNCIKHNIFLIESKRTEVSKNTQLHWSLRFCWTKSMFISIQGPAFRTLKRVTTILGGLWSKFHHYPAIEVSISRSTVF